MLLSYYYKIIDFSLVLVVVVIESKFFSNISYLGIAEIFLTQYSYSRSFFNLDNENGAEDVPTLIDRSVRTCHWQFLVSS